MTAPLAIFVYNRPDKLRRMLSSLTACDAFSNRPIHVFCDGPKFEEPDDPIIAARCVAREILGGEAVYHEVTVNKGLARSIIEGVDDLTRNLGQVIVIEDDLELAPGFLTFMDRALDHYADDPTVMQVSGHVFDVPEFKDRDAAVVLPLTTTWGWATWRRAWASFDCTAASARRVLSSRSKRKSFNLGGIYDYASMLEDQLSGNRDSWGIRFYLSVFEANGLGVFPPRTLVRNTGFDGSGSHGRGWLRSYDAPICIKSDTDPRLWSFPPPIPSEQEFNALKRAMWRQNGGRFGQIADVAKRTLRNRSWFVGQ